MTVIGGFAGFSAGFAIAGFPAAGFAIAGFMLIFFASPASLFFKIIFFRSYNQ